MRRRSRNLFGICISLFIAAARGQAQEPNTIVIDIARQGAGSTLTVPVNPGPAVFIVQNLAPSPALTYSFAIAEELIVPPPFEIPDFLKSSTEGADACSRLDLAVAELLALHDEAKIPDALTAIAAVPDTGCTSETIGARDEAIRRTRRVFPYNMLANRTVRLTITRSGPTAASPTKTWLLAVTTPGRGSWFTSYGAMMGPSRDEEHFLMSSGDDKFKVQAEREDEGLTAIPSILFSWAPRDALDRNFYVSPVGALGVRDNRPAFGIGAGVFFNFNLGLVGGVSFAPVKLLRGKYNLDDELSENLSDDQLHEWTMKPAGFVGFTFRFGEWPFARVGGGENPPAQGGGKADPNGAQPEKKK